ncbi:aminoglycoside phosphotransferase [Annulohypoxylon maeteangense]|uniref:aminoglycoside phosphotransferase n=1 Tax=Annulohypoxylon maeteangense TaxID=1927788 RepID=UPI002007A60F|nr:aminoglycoside phosphotransferase [Annulohypoxylon maeteangense]KAI0884237.1 aminoglycoside phosphotransferase [Annulohypoxylon maeteangense]
MASKTESSLEKLPAIPAEVSTQWLESKLGHKIKSASLTRSIFGTGSKLFFTIEYAVEIADVNSRPTNICVKGVFDPAMVESQPWTLSLAQREANFFAKIAPSIKHMGYPRGWWGGTSDSQGIAIMSDLTHEGCTFPSEAASYPVEKALDGAAQIAGLHAQFWGKSQDDYPWISNDYDVAMKFIASPWDSVVREPGRPKLPEYLMDGARVKRAQDKYYAQRNPRFRTLLHGDTHLGNVYFTSEGHTRFLDWSAFHFASCFHDLVYFVSTTLTVEDRRAHEMDVLDHYLATLHRLGGPKFDRDDEELMIEYKRSYMTNIIWPVCGYDLQTKERVDAFTERTIAAWVDHKVIEVIEAQ